MDLCIITAERTEHIRPFDKAAKEGPRYSSNYTSSKVLLSLIVNVIVIVVEI